MRFHNSRKTKIKTFFSSLQFIDTLAVEKYIKFVCLFVMKNNIELEKLVSCDI